MTEKRFDPKKLNKLNNPDRLKQLPPEFIIEKAGLKNLKTMVDVGAGTGFFSIQFAEKFKDSTIHACDISDVMISWMKENVSPKYDSVIPAKMNDNEIPLNDNVGDFVLMINLHHELDNPVKMLTDCKRVLKKGGKIAIVDWKKEEMEMGPPYEIRCEANSIKEHLVKSGFNHVQIHDDLKYYNLLIAEKL